MSGEPQRSQIEKLGATHDCTQFDCGNEALNRFLQRYALANQAGGSATTYVTCRGESVVGYYSLAAGGVIHQQAPARVAKGQPKHDIPVMLLARLAVDRREQGKGIGKALLKDSLLRTAKVADMAGIRALLVHAKDESARRWYGQFDFEPSPTDPMHLFLLIKDIRKALSR